MKNRNPLGSKKIARTTTACRHAHSHTHTNAETRSLTTPKVQ
jgi:hypothetical protein